MGYIKRTPLSEFRAQNRGGVGAKGSNTREEDFIEYIYPASMHNYMLFFTQKGKCYWLKVYEIPEGAKNSKGRAIQNAQYRVRRQGKRIHSGKKITRPRIQYVS